MGIINLTWNFVMGKSEINDDRWYIDPNELIRKQNSDDLRRQHKTKAKLRLRRMQMRRQGKLALAGYQLPTPSINGDCQKVWRKYGWLPREEALKAAAAKSGNLTKIPRKSIAV